MKKRLPAKLRSQAGASITFALLLFLVCAVLCSVIIAAATASSGRMSQIAENDQRYYAVSSAAELLKTLIDGKTVSIVEVKESNVTTTYSGGIAGTSAEDSPTSTTYLVPNAKAASIRPAEHYISANKVGDSLVIDSIPKDAAKNIHSGTPPDSNGNVLTNRTLSLRSTFYNTAGLDYDILAVTISEKLSQNGTLELTIYNTNKSNATQSNAGSRYQMILEFGADRSETSSTKMENVSSTAVDEHTYTVVTKKTETTITTLTWNLIRIKTTF